MKLIHTLLICCLILIIILLLISLKSINEISGKVSELVIKENIAQIKLDSQNQTFIIFYKEPLKIKIEDRVTIFYKTEFQNSHISEVVQKIIKTN